MTHPPFEQQLNRRKPDAQITPTSVELAVAHLECWLESMWSPGGYGGPVAHWWQQSLIYTGPGLDWRYEGIVIGYLHLWQHTQDRRWLEKARRAGDDLLAGQRPDGHFVASAFEINPATAGTPHEAACDVALLRLASALSATDEAGWQAYAAAAERNLRTFYLQTLWDDQTRSFRDDPQTPTFVPNKAATASEACFLLATLREDEIWVEQYALPNLERILDYQLCDGSVLDGAIAQNSFGHRRLEKYFPLYVARCVPALLRGHQWTADPRYLGAALRAMEFIARNVDSNGELPTVIYADGKASRNPSWVAPLADVLRAARSLAPFGFDPDRLAAVRGRLLAGQDRSGAFQTATGFDAQGGGRAKPDLDLRDVLHVVGWCDKVFRYLTAEVVSPPPQVAADWQFETLCTFQGRSLGFRETPQLVDVRCGEKVIYRWRKGRSWADVAEPAFWLR